MQISHIIHAPPLPCLQIFTEGQTGLPLLHSDFSPALHLPPDSVDVLLYLEFCLASTSQWLCCYYYVSSLAGLRAWQVSGPGFWGPGCKRATGRPVLLTRSHVLKQHNATLLLITIIILLPGFWLNVEPTVQPSARSPWRWAEGKWYWGMQSSVWVGGLTSQVMPRRMVACPIGHYWNPERDKMPVESFSERDQMLLRNLFALQYQAMGEQSEEREAALTLLRIK